jgi:tetratricopeptide (TPR) repeat protein
VWAELYQAKYVPSCRVPSADQSELRATRRGQITAAPTQHQFQRGLELYLEGKYRDALYFMLKALQNTPDDADIRCYLASIYIKLGLESQRQGDLHQQRVYYKQALAVDPSLIQNADFIVSYRHLQTSADSSIISRSTVRTIPLPKNKTVGFGIGLTLGIDGFLGLQTSLLIAGIVNPSLTFSPIQQTLDISMRIIPLRAYEWSPYLTLGVAFPVAIHKVHHFRELRQPCIHLSLGVQYLSSIGFAFSAGISIPYHFHTKHELSFVPVPSVQVAWYF